MNEQELNDLIKSVSADIIGVLSDHRLSKRNTFLVLLRLLEITIGLSSDGQAKAMTEILEEFVAEQEDSVNGRLHEQQDT